jgi:CHASE2 domain-containing sensor protein
MRGRKIVILSAGALLLAGLCYCLHQYLPFVRNSFTDLNFLLNTDAPCDSVVIVGIDEPSIAAIGGFPWPRSTQAALIEKIRQCGPRVIALDFEFPRRENDSDNDSLASIFSKVDNLVIPFRARLVSNDENPTVAPIPIEAYTSRFFIVRQPEKLAKLQLYASRAIDISDPLFAQYADRSGFFNVTTNRLGQSLRELIHVIRAGDDYFPSFALAATALWYRAGSENFAISGQPAVTVGPRTIPLSSYAGTTFLNFRGRAGTIPTLSAVDILRGAVDPARLADKLVFVGMTDAAASADFFITPVGSRFPGVEVWATAAADIIEKQWLTPAKGIIAAINWIMTLLLFPGLALLIPLRRKWLSLLLSTAILLLSVAGVFILFRFMHVLWNPEYHLYAWIFALVWLAAGKVDPTLIEIMPIELEPADAAERDTLPPPRPEDYITSVPDNVTMKYILAKLGARPELDPAIARRLRDLDGSQIVRTLGSGGMADVYLVWNPRMEVYRAVKVIRPDNENQLLDRFETEIKIFAALCHPNIVQCFTVGYWHTLPYLEMEFIPGASMEGVLSKCGAIAPEQVIAIGILVCRALHYAHRQVVNIHGQSFKGVIHRDIKPANIMFSRHGRIKLTDFGIARPTTVSIHTGDAGKIIGTLPYLAPEQLDGKEITASADIYALGATLYELLTGERAFPQREITTLINAKSKGIVKPLDGVANSMQLGQIINKALALQPCDRFASAQEMGTALEGLLIKQASQPVLAALVTRMGD